MATFPKTSRTVTEKFWATPAVATDGPESDSEMGASGVTMIPDSVPVALPTAASIALIDWTPADLRVMEKVWTPASAAVKV